MPGEALLRLAEVAPWVVVAVLLGAFLLFALGMQPAAESNGPRVVIVDDDPEVRLALRRMIENRTSLRVVGEAADGSAGLATIEDLIPDAVIVDVKMPVVDGIKLARTVKARHPYIKIVGFSSADDDPTGAIMRNAGASRTLVKGDPPDQIVAALREI